MIIVHGHGEFHRIVKRGPGSHGRAAGLQVLPAQRTIDAVEDKFFIRLSGESEIRDEPGDRAIQISGNGIRADRGCARASRLALAAKHEIRRRSMGRIAVIKPIPATLRTETVAPIDHAVAA